MDGPHVAPAHLRDAVEAERHRSARTTVAGRRQEEQAHRVADGLPEGRVGQDPLVEPQADELARPAGPSPVEGADERLRERQEEDGGEVHQGGQDEQKSCPPLAVHVGPGNDEPDHSAHGPARLARPASP